MWTRCPGQAWPRGSLTIKHYRVQVEPSLMTSKSPRVEVQRVHLGQTPLSLNNSISGLVCSEHIWNEGCKSPDHRILRTCAWLIWNDSRKTKQSSSNSWRQLASYAHELGKITTFIQTYASWTKHEEMLTQVSNTRLMFNMIHGGRQNATDGLNSNSSEFPYHWTSTIMWTRW